MYRFLWHVWVALLMFAFFAEPERLLVDKKEAGRMLGVCARTIGNLMRMKSLPTRRIGRRSLIPVAALKRFVQSDHPESPANFVRDEQQVKSESESAQKNGKSKN